MTVYKIGKIFYRNPIQLITFKTYASNIYMNIGTTYMGLVL